MTKTELVSLYRELEAKQSTTNVEPKDMIQRLREQGYIVKERVRYELR